MLASPGSAGSSGFKERIEAPQEDFGGPAIEAISTFPFLTFLLHVWKKL
nr:hypothetical protein [uncultured archaeon]